MYVCMCIYIIDVYCHLSRLGQNCENLPEGVLASPSERDSTILRANSITMVRAGSLPLT
jgi:hypothetical protein